MLGAVLFGRGEPDGATGALLMAACVVGALVCLVGESGVDGGLRQRGTLGLSKGAGTLVTQKGFDGLSPNGLRAP